MCTKSNCKFPKLQAFREPAQRGGRSYHQIALRMSHRHLDSVNEVQPQDGKDKSNALVAQEKRGPLVEAPQTAVMHLANEMDVNQVEENLNSIWKVLSKFPF